MVVARAGDGLLNSRPFVTALACALAYFTSLGMVMPEVPHFVVDRLGGNGAEVGVAAGVFTFTACALRSPAGHLSRRMGPRITTMVGTGLAAGSVLAYTLAHNLGTLVVLRMVSGAGEAATFVGLSRFVYDLAPPGRTGEATSYFTVSLFGGFALGPVIGEEVRRQAGFGPVWFIAAGFAALALLVSIWLRGTAPVGAPALADRADRAPRPAWYRTWVQRDALGPATILLVGMAGYSGLSTFVPLYVAHLHLSSAGPVLAENAIIVLVIRLFFARLPDRLGPARSSASSLVLQALGWTTIAFWVSPAGLYVGSALFAGGVSLLYPALFSFAVGRAPLAERDQAVATFSMFFDLSVGSGAVLLGAIVSLTGGEQAAFFAGAVLNVMALALMGLRPQWVRAPTVRVTASA